MTKTYISTEKLILAHTMAKKKNKNYILRACNASQF